MSTITVEQLLIEFFRAAKATRKTPGGKLHPSGRLLRSFERDGAERIASAFAGLRRRLFSGLSDDSIEQALSRMNDADVMRPFRDTLNALIREWAEAGADFGREQVERAIFGTQKQVADGFAVDWALANDMAADWARQYSFGLVRGIEDTTKKYLQREISGFATSGETFQQFSRRMIDASVFSPQRAQMIAVTEVTRSYAQGNVSAWQASGVTEGKEWNTANDELVCPICGPLDGKQTKLDGKFEGGYEGPPAHPRCRCWLTPVAIGDLTPGEELLITGTEGITEERALERERFRRFEADPFGGEDEIWAWGDEATYSAWNRELTDKEREWLALYKQEGYEWINTALRGDFSYMEQLGIDFDDYEDAIDFIDTAIRKHKLPDEITVWRGGSHPVLTDALNNGRNLDDLVGMVIGDDAYISTSLDSGAADNFVKWAGKDAFKFEIQLPKGTSGAFVEYMDPGLQEYEFLLSRGTKFEILEASMKDGIRHVLARII